MNFETVIRNKKIAVVGNSASLFDQNYGEEIDNHDVVIRFNKPAPLLIDNCIITHGQKFDIWAFWAIGAFHKKVVEVEENINLIKDVFYNNKDIIKIQLSKSPNNVDVAKKHTFDTLPYRYMKELKRQLLYSKIYVSQTELKNQEKLINHANKRMLLEPSAGVGILFWLKISNPAHVSVFGMDFKKTPTFSEIEKYDKDMIGRVDIRCKHNFALEEAYVKNVILKDKRFELK